MTLHQGQRLGHYVVLGPIGAGGMGEVYRARDERLEREVAIKLLPAEVADVHERLVRFRREARALAALSHPNVLTIFELGSEREVIFLVTELVEGETLRDLVHRGALSWRRALEIGIAIADGLAAAHAAGIVHRDLKPSNVVVTGSGRVKILDFGLARMEESVAADGETTALAAELTRTGTVLGTLGYMAPEQVRGESCDHRTDIFALGCVLHELLTGTPAFRRATPAESVAAVLTEVPPAPSLSGPGIPSELDRVVAHCLEKRPSDRFQSAGDLLFALRGLTGGRAGSPPGAGGERDLSHPVALPSVAVLSFANLSGDPEQEYFCDGVSEEIITALAQVTGLRVVARTSSFAFKGRSEDIREIGRKLEVATLLDGSVRRSGDRLRITAQLIDTADGTHLWSERFDRRLEDVFAIQDEIAGAVASNLQVRLLGGEPGAAPSRHAQSLDAHNAYLRGVFEWNRLTPDAFARSRALFEKAIGLDPGHVPAYVALANWYGSQCFWGQLEPGPALDEAERLGAQALALDEESAHVHLLLGVAGFSRFRWSQAEASLRKAVQLGPSLATAHLHLGGLMLLRGRRGEAVNPIRTALRLDPLSPTTTAWGANWLALAGAYDEGVAVLEGMLDMYPQHFLPHWSLALTLTAGGRADDARAHAAQAVALSGRAPITVAVHACLCHLTGERERGHALHEELGGRAAVAYVPPTLLAWIELARGDLDAGVAALECARRAGDPVLAFTALCSGSLFASHPRVEELVASLLD